MDILDKFDNLVDTQALAKDAKEAMKNDGNKDFENVPHGKYEVKIEKLEIKESKNGNPMLSAWFKILEGSHKGSLIFMNQVITQGFQIHIANTILRALSNKTIAVDFENYHQYNDVVCDVFEYTGSHEYLLNYSQNKKGYDTFTIEEVFEVDNVPF